MVKFNYKRLAGTATRLLERFGTIVPTRFKSRAPGVPNPATGKVDYGYLGQEFAIELDTVAVLVDYAQRDVDGTLVQVGDQRIFLPPTLPVAPKTGDILSVAILEQDVVVGYEDYEIIQARREAPGGVVVIYEVQGRRD